MFESKTIMVLPDPHDEPGVDKERFEWAGRMAADRLPDAIVCLGDGVTMDSLSEYDLGSVHHEGLRYQDDIDSFHEAMDRFHKPIDELNTRLKRSKKKQYDPKLVYNEGNHEHRIVKAVTKDPRLIRTMSLDDLGLKERGWDFYPITEPANVYGVNFAHYFTSGIMGRPISGINHARNLVGKTYTNCVVGHSHDRSFWEDTDINGNKIMGIVAGCYFTHPLKYTTEEDRNWPGIIMLTVYEKHIDPEFICIDYIKETYQC